MRIWPTKRGWKRFGIALLILVAAALVFNGVMAWRIEMQFRSKIAAIRAAGEPASIADLAPVPIPESENAAAILDKLGPRLNEFSMDYGHFLVKDALGIDFGKRRELGEPPTADQAKAIRALLSKYPDIEIGLATAAACDKYASVADFSVGYRKLLEVYLQKQPVLIRSAARYLVWDMEALYSEGKNEQAVNRGIALLRLARLYDHEPLVVNMLVAIALRTIATEPLYDALTTGPLTPATHVALDQELALHENFPRMVHALKTERAYSIDAARAIPCEDSVKPPRWMFAVVGWTVKRFYAGVLDYYEVEIPAANKLWHAGHGKVGRHKLPEEPSGFGTLADLLIPATQAAYNADARCTAQLRALRIVNALREFAEKNGREAKGLDELGLPREATIDPFSGKPLKLKHTDDGWIVYSVMTNGVDDGGDFKDMKDYGVAPRKWRRVQ